LHQIFFFLLSQEFGIQWCKGKIMIRGHQQLSLWDLVFRLHIFTSILRRLLMSRRCSHGNRKSMGFGRKWRRESPTIKCIIVFSFIIVCPFHHVPNGSPSDSGWWIFQWSALRLGNYISSD
jgi:hypothetical protein